MSDLHLVIPLSEFFSNLSDSSPVRHTLFATFPNIIDQRYVVGADYPEDIGNEEFIYHQWDGFTAKIQCTFFVCRDEQFTISEGEPGVSKTFVNSRALKQPHILYDGDSISFGKPKLFGETVDGPAFLVRFKPKSPNEYDPVKTRPEIEACATEASSSAFAGSPFDIDLILSLIFKYCDIQDLKRSRLVCYRWNRVAQIQLEERGTVYFDFDKSYGIPKNSMRVFNYLHETKNFEIKSLKVQFSYGEYSKWNDDFVKLLSAKKFTSLNINTSVEESDSFEKFLYILQTLGDNLQELKFGTDFQLTFIPDGFSTSSELSFKLLKKFAHLGGDSMDEEALKKWISYFVPKIGGKLEEFECNGDISHLYIEEILKAKPEMLQSLAITIGPDPPFTTDIPRLLQIRTSLTTLILDPIKLIDQDCASQIGNLLKLHSKSLTRLCLGIEAEEPIEIFIPKMPTLQEFRFHYTINVKIQWETGKLDYSVHFPVLRRLEIYKSHGSCATVNLNQQNANDPFEWEQDGSVFSEFFPANGEEVCRTVTNLVIRTLQTDGKISGNEYKRYHLRLFKIADMFPEVQLRALEGFGITDEECNYRSEKNISRRESDGDDFAWFSIPDDDSDYDEPNFPPDDKSSESSDSS